MKHLHGLNTTALVLLLIGGINWGLVGVFQIDLITAIFGYMIARVIFVIVGVAAIYRICSWIRANSAK